MSPSPTHTLSRLLVFWFAAYQLLHLLVNLRGLSRLRSGRPLDFPAPPPPEGWTEQTLHFFSGMAVADVLGALLGLAFAFAYVRQLRWWLSCGLVALTVSLYAAAVFNYATWSAGAWAGENLRVYLAVNSLYLPVLVLAALTIRWSFSRGHPAA